jgi:hypothetical protein
MLQGDVKYERRTMNIEGFHTRGRAVRVVLMDSKKVGWVNYVINNKGYSKGRKVSLIE